MQSQQKNQQRGMRVKRHESNKEKDSGDYLIADKKLLLTSAQECDLARRARAGDEMARNQLIEHNVRLVISIAKGYVRDGVLLDDLIQDGMIGLMRAVAHFDPDLLNPKTNRPYRFSTSATWWIHQNIRRCLPDYLTPVRLPVYVNTLLNKLARTIARLTAEQGCEPTPQDIADALGMSVEQVDSLQQLRRVALSLEMEVDDGGTGRDTSLKDLIADPSDTQLSQNVEQTELQRCIASILATLPDREQTVVRLRFGFDGRERTLEEVGKELHVTRERIRQIEVKALRLLSPQMRVLKQQWDMAS